MTCIQLSNLSTESWQPSPKPLVSTLLQRCLSMTFHQCCPTSQRTGLLPAMCFKRGLGRPFNLIFIFSLFEDQFPLGSRCATLKMSQETSMTMRHLQNATASGSSVPSTQARPTHVTLMRWIWMDYAAMDSVIS